MSFPLRVRVGCVVDAGALAVAAWTFPVAAGGSAGTFTATSRFGRA
jgi:hypothetical protein